MMPASESQSGGWLNPAYKSQSFDLPYKVAVFDQFLTTERLRELQGRYHPLLKSSHQAYNRHIIPIDHLDYVRFLYSDSMKQIIIDEFRVTKVFSLPNCFPTYRFSSDAPADQVHNDYGFKERIIPRIGMVYFISEGYESRFGGCFNVLFRKNRNYELSRAIEPVSNRLILFQIGPNSYHNVDATHEGWCRQTFINQYGYEGVSICKISNFPQH